MRVALAFLMLAACSSDFTPDASNAWDIGPTISGTNYSHGGSVNGNSIQIEDAHYITKAATGPLIGTMTVTFNLSAPLTGTGCGTSPATASLYFQAHGDENMVRDGTRWWASFATVTLDHAGDYTITAPMDGPWTSVLTMTALNNPQQFLADKANPARVGFTLGNCTGLGHGGTGPATLTITSFH